MIVEYERQKKPVAMFEYNVDEADMGGRKGRYWQNGGTGELPLVLVNSGREVTWGSHGDFKKKYGGMISPAMAEPATAEVHAWFKRSTLDAVRVQVDVKNVGSVTLDPFAEKAAQVVVFLVEDVKEVHMTKTARGVAYIELPDELKPGESVQLEGEVAGAKGTNFNKSKVVAVLEYGDDAGWDIAGGTWATQGDRPAAVPPTAPPPTAEPPTAVPTEAPPTAEPTDIPTAVPPTAAPTAAPTRFFSYLPMALFSAVLGQQP